MKYMFFLYDNLKKLFFLTFIIIVYLVVFTSLLHANNEDDNEDNEKNYLFNYNFESKIDKINNERLKKKKLLQKISTDYFKIYLDEDEENYVVIAEFPFGKDNSKYTLKFKDPFQLIITFTNKIDSSKKPVIYEIFFPEPTLKKAFDFTVRDKLELNIPIDFFYTERNTK